MHEEAAGVHVFRALWGIKNSINERLQLLSLRLEEYT